MSHTKSPHPQKKFSHVDKHRCVGIPERPSATTRVERRVRGRGYRTPVLVMGGGITGVLLSSLRFVSVVGLSPYLSSKCSNHASWKPKPSQAFPRTVSDRTPFDRRRRRYFRQSLGPLLEEDHSHPASVEEDRVVPGLSGGTREDHRTP